MNVLIDTCVWSLVLRRTQPRVDLSLELQTLVADGRAAIIGPIRQELLSGIREKRHFDALRRNLESFPDVELGSADYERAAEYFNHARSFGVQGSNTDFLICAVAVDRELSVFTVDEDFGRYAELFPLSLHALSSPSIGRVSEPRTLTRARKVRKS